MLGFRLSCTAILIQKFHWAYLVFCDKSIRIEGKLFQNNLSVKCMPNQRNILMVFICHTQSSLNQIPLFAGFL